MKKILFYMGLVFCIFLFILGMFDLEETRFGFNSPLMIIAILLLVTIYFKHLIDNIENRLDKLEFNKQ